MVCDLLRLETRFVREAEPLGVMPGCASADPRTGGRKSEHALDAIGSASYFSWIDFRYSTISSIRARLISSL